MLQKDGIKSSNENIKIFRLNALQFRPNDGIIIDVFVFSQVGSVPYFRGGSMQEFMTTKEAAKKWNISIRQVQNHCKNGRIKGILRVGTNYLIPQDAMKPTYVYLYEPKETSK